MPAPSNETAFSRSARATPLRASRARASGTRIGRTWAWKSPADVVPNLSDLSISNEPGRPGVDEIVFQAAQPWLFRQSGLDGGGERDRPGPDPEESEGRGRGALDHRRMRGADGEGDGEGDRYEGGDREEAGPQGPRQLSAPAT